MASGPNRNIPSTSTMSVSLGSNDNISSTSTTSVSLGSNDNAPSTSTTSVSHGSNDNIPSTSTTSVSHISNDNVPSTSTTSVSHGSIDNIPSTSTTSVSLRSNDNAPSTSTTSVSHESNDNIPSTSTTSVSHISNDNIPSTSTMSVSHGTNEPQSAACNEQIDILYTRQIVDRNLCTGNTGGASGQNTGNRGVVAGAVNATNVQAGDHNIINYAPGGASGQNTGNRGVVAGAVNATNVQTGDHNIINCAPDQMAELIDVTNQKLDIYKKKEGKRFVESPAFKQCELRVTENGLVTIFGAPGDGKTTIGFELLCRLRNRTNRKTIPIIISNTNDWYKVHRPSSNELLVIFFDDMLGKFVLNANLKDIWISESPNILPFVQDGKIQVIITCRDKIFSTAKNELQRLELFNAKSRIHLSGPNCEYPLDEETQFNIIKKHIELEENMEICADRSEEVLTPKSDQDCRISVETLKKISEKSYVGFMLMCKIFVLSPEFRSKREKFFERAGDYLVEEIDHLQSSRDEDEKYDYCTLVCVLVKQGLNVEQIEGDEIVEKIATSCRIHLTRTLKYEINLAVERLTSTYLNKINDEYQFHHNSWMESVFKSFFKSNASLLIEYCEFGLIDLITTEKNRDKSAGLCELSNDGQYMSLFQRLLSEMTDGNVKSVFFHQCFTDSDFTRKFRDWLESDKKRKQAMLMSEEPDRERAARFRVIKKPSGEVGPWMRLAGKIGDTKRSVLYWAARKADVNFVVWVEKGLRQLSTRWNWFGLRQSVKCDMKKEMSAALKSASMGNNLPVCRWLESQPGIVLDMTI